MRVRVLALVTMALLLCNIAYAQKGQFAVPSGAEMEKYPIKAKILTVSEIAEMHLHPVRLDKPTVVQNHFRGLHDKEGRFVVETLPVGTLVLSDEDDNIRYKADCGNRLVEFVNVAIDNAKLVKAEAPAPAPLKTVVLPTPKKGLFQMLADYFKRAATGVWGFIGDLMAPIGWMTLYLLGLLTLLLLAYLAFWVARELLRWIRGDRPAPPAPAQVIGPGPGRPPAPTTRATSEPQVPPVPPVGTESPATPRTGRRFIHHAPQNGTRPAMIRWGGFNFHSMETGEDGVHTIRYSNPE